MLTSNLFEIVRFVEQHKTFQSIYFFGFDLKSKDFRNMPVYRKEVVASALLDMEKHIYYNIPAGNLKYSISPINYIKNAIRIYEYIYMYI